MTNAFFSEWLKLRRRAMLLGGIGATMAVTALATVVQLVTVGDDGAPGGSTVTVASLQEAGGLAAGVAGAATFIGAVTLTLWAINMANEYTLGTLRNLLVRQPHRLRLLAGKLLALASFTVVAVTLASAMSIAMSFAMAPVNGIDTSAWTTTSALGEVASTWTNTVLAAIGFGLIGASLGIFLRAPAGAIGAGLAWLLIGELILSQAWNEVGRWLPGQLLQAISEGGDTSMPYLTAVTGAMVVIGSFTAASGYLFAHREVAG